MVDLISPLPRDECVQRLQASTDSEWKLFGGGPVMGRIGKTSLRLHRRIRYRNSFQTQLFAQLVDEGHRTRLHCRFGFHPFITVFIVVWCGFALVLGGAMSIPLLKAGSPTSQQWLGVVIPFALLAFLVAMVQFGRFLSRNDPQFLIDFLCRTLEARDAPPA